MEVEASTIVPQTTKKEFEGNLTIVVFPFLKASHKAPDATAKEIGDYLVANCEAVKEYNVIVNCTPIGMYPHADECPNIPYHVMDMHTLLYDLIYNPDETLFMKKGKEHGATVKNGLEMLLLQAFASWDFWHQEK